MRSGSLPLDGLKALTDEVGVFQHAKFSTIDRREGYTTDDNARALIAALRYHRAYGGPESLRLAETYLAFLLHMQLEDGRFRNLLGFDRAYRDEAGSEDCMGHALWACGCAVSSDAPDDMRSAAKELFDKGLPPSRGFTSPRAKASTILGLCHYREAFPDDGNITEDVEAMAGGLVDQYMVEAGEGWRWFEAYLTYANARLPQALFAAYGCTGDPSFLRVARGSFGFLVETQVLGGVFQPIGSDGWYTRGGARAFYDQQPIEASCMVEAALAAFGATGEEGYAETARIAFEWYHGGNILNVDLLDDRSGTCYDGITPEGLNLNQGAEATVSYYLAYLRMREHGLL